MKTYKNFLFDLDGTLLDTLPGLTDSLNAALAQNGCATHSQQAVRRIIGNGIPKTIGRALPGGPAHPLYSEVLRSFQAHYAVHANDKTALFPGIAELLDALRARGCVTACVTNKDHAVAVPMIRSFCGDRLSITVGRREGAQPKPDPAAVWEVLRTLSLDPAESVYIGDSEVDYQTACNAGLDCILVLWGYRDEPELLALPAVGHLRAPDELLAFAR